jgi:ABC-type sugar transport system permease subunit
VQTKAVRRRLGGPGLTDRAAVALMVGLPLAVHVILVWVPALASIVLSWTRWDGIGGLDSIEWIGADNYRNLATTYPAFWPAVWHNVLWLVVFVAVPTPLGILLAVVLDRTMRGSAFYQSVFYLPVVISMPLIGFITQLMFSPDQGLVNGLLGRPVDWLGDPDLNLPVVLLMASWRQAGYVMILYLAGLKTVDPTLREAAALDGANEPRTFLKVIFPTLRPVNVVILVITVIESLRAFDIVYVINKGQNGLELLSVLVTNNILGEASRIGFGSAIGVILLVISLVSIITYLWNAFRREDA